MTSAMVTPTCSKCGKAIPSEDVNVANDIAYCRACNLSHKLSALTEGTELDTIILETREGKLVKFGSMLREDRRKFVAGAVRKVLWG